MESTKPGAKQRLGFCYVEHKCSPTAEPEALLYILPPACAAYTELKLRAYSSAFP
jgi:hypothetical protein